MIALRTRASLAMRRVGVPWAMLLVAALLIGLAAACMVHAIAAGAEPPSNHVRPPIAAVDEEEVQL